MSPAKKKSTKKKPAAARAAAPAAAPDRSTADGITSLEQARAEIRLLSSLIEASQTINSTLDLDEMLPRILQTATHNIRADRGTWSP